jgi:hypothetical protein
MSERKSEGLSDLNIVAANEFKRALAGDTELLPEWKQAITQLFESGIPRDLEALSGLVKGDSDAETKAA